MKVLVTGANGFVGNALSIRLETDGYSVVRAVRQKRFSSEIAVNDIAPDTNWQVALQGVDTVVHLAARVHIINDRAENPLAEFRFINVEGTRRVAECAVRACVNRLVFLSSVKVNGEETRHAAFTERDVPDPQDAYAVSKWEAEQVLRQIEAESGMDVVILRPPLIYGPGVKANFLNLAEIIGKGMPLPLGRITNVRSMLGLSNMVSAIIACVENKKAAGKTYLVSDGEDVSSPELVRRIAAALGRKPRLLPVPAAWLRLAGKLIGKNAQIERLIGSLAIDSSAIRNDLGWRPVCSMQDELARLAADMRK